MMTVGAREPNRARGGRGEGEDWIKPKIRFIYITKTTTKLA
jgi:hypothetical protein